MKKPNDFIEVFMSLIKWFLIILLVNNLIWAGVVYVLVAGNDASITQMQDGTNNTQEMING